VRKYIGQLRTERSLGAHYTISAPPADVRLKRQMKHMTGDDGSKSVRALQLGLRAQHFRDATLTSFDRESWWGIVRWAFLRLGYRCCSRGGELGTTDDHDFVIERGLTWASFTWHDASPGTDGRQFFIVYYMKIKDGKLTAERVPIITRRTLEPGDKSRHPMCVYDAVRTAWDMQSQEVPAEHAGGCQPGCACQRSQTAFFRRVSRVPVRTSDVKEGVRQLVGSLGLEPSQYGGMSCRVGFATDAVDTYGQTVADDLFQQMGRWAGDMWQIYARISASAHMRSAEEIEMSSGVSIEELADGWVQPAARRTRR